MKKLIVVCILVFVAMGSVPAMARMVELTDSEMELITGQASDIGVPTQAPALEMASVERYIHVDSMNLNTMAEDFGLAEIELARTVISIDSVETETFLGPVVAKGITVDMEAGTRIRFF